MRLMSFLTILFATVFAALPVMAEEPAQREALEKAFAEKLTNATLVGSFSVDGKEDAKTDRYQIVKAEKLEGDDWEITARMKIGQNQVDLPIVLKVFWADDTPVMSLTNLTIPGVGSAFTTRLMFHGDRYAGSWQHGSYGGLMWGRIEKTTEKTE